MLKAQSSCHQNAFLFIFSMMDITGWKCYILLLFFPPKNYLNELISNSVEKKKESKNKIVFLGYHKSLIKLYSFCFVLQVGETSF